MSNFAQSEINGISFAVTAAVLFVAYFKLVLRRRCSPYVLLFSKLMLFLVVGPIALNQFLRVQFYFGITQPEEWDGGFYIYIATLVVLLVFAITEITMRTNGHS
jgi:hypothetical protein